jgi:hypothetical protein
MPPLPLSLWTMPAQPPHFPLLHLPAEVRLEVYKHYFTQDEPIRVPPLPRSKPFDEWRNISLLAVSRQTYAEAFAIFYQTNTFWIVRDIYPYGPFSERARRLIKALRFGTGYPEIWVSCLFIMVPPDPGAETTKSVLRQAFDPDHKPEKPLSLHPVLKVIRLRCRLPEDVCKVIEQHHFEHWEVRRTSAAPTKDGYAYVRGLRFQARQ